MSDILQPIQMGELKLKNRIFMAPLTRCRASGVDGRTPNELMVKYYTQRASAGLIITEATNIEPMGVGYANTPGIWLTEHIDGWKKITKSVHDCDGKIFMQLWHVGRISHPLFLNGNLPVAPSAIAPNGYVNLLQPKERFVEPRALDLSEIKIIVQNYKKAAENAKIAGFDGVEIHGANGYLIDQFLQDCSNKRSDEYGGSIQNRARFLLEVTDAVIQVWGSSRVGMHLAPRCDSHSMGDSNREATFIYVAEELGKRKIAFICAREYEAPDSIGPKLKKIFKGIYIGNEKFTKQTANNALERNDIDAVAFGKDYIANPDLVLRIENNFDLNKPDPATFYRGGVEGYTNYPLIT